MRHIGNDALFHVDSITFATAYCADPPVPVSPTTANRKGDEPGGIAFGTTGIANPITERNTARTASRNMARTPPIGLRHGVSNEIDDEVGLPVSQNEMAANKSIFQFLR